MVFTLFGPNYVFKSITLNLCMCSGMICHITIDDEKILYDNYSNHMKDCFNLLSNYIKYVHDVEVKSVIGQAVLLKYDIIKNS